MLKLRLILAALLALAIVAPVAAKGPDAEWRRCTSGHC